MDIHFDHDVETTSSTIPEHSLLTAIVYRSILDYLNDTGAEYARDAQRTARHWFWPFDREANEPFSFNWVAEHLSENPVAFKKTIRNYLKSAPTRMDVREKFGKFGRRGSFGLSPDWRMGL